MSEDKAWDEGLAALDQVYGAGFAENMRGREESAPTGEIVRHLFRDIWMRPGLSMRDKRLLVIGATTMLGRSDLLATQITGAILNRELDAAQLDEIALLMIFYAGAGNSSALQQAIRQAKEQAAARSPA